MAEGIVASTGQLGVRVGSASLAAGALPLAEPTGSVHIGFDVPVRENEADYGYHADVLVFRVGAAEIQLTATGDGGPTPSDEHRLSALLVHRARVSRHP